jgi:ATP-dependent RNA helicase HelY
VRTDRAALIAHYPFPLDEFQLSALEALDKGSSVLVAAPTGSGKTVVAEYGIAAAIADGKRAFYTAPIKALSNQKFQDLMKVYGADKVGLLTGDNSVRGDARIVVMTTEVLRNMIYARSTSLTDLGLVVLDEVHFLQDAYRGPVWEEVIVHLPMSVQLVCLSATVSNAAEIAEWMTTVRGTTACVVEERRPVRLDNLYLVGDRTTDKLHLLPTIIRGAPNPAAGRLDDEAARGWKGGTNRHKARRKLYTPSRIEMVERLERERMLPAICFIFSRKQCDEAARSCLAAGLRLNSADERDRIREIVTTRLDGIEKRDLAVLGYTQFVAQLDAGIASHHAGMVPPFKEVVEACFTAGLIKVVFATETLAVGLNMPAKSVVIEKLTKFTGDHHAMLTAGEYTQLTGRAGRRGIDELGNAVVLWNPFVTFEQAASLALSRSFHLNSAFRPTYNMTCNLVRAYDRDEAHHLLSLSLAQYQSDGDVVRVEARIRRRENQYEELRESSKSSYGDIDEYRASLNRRGESKIGPVGGGGAAVEHALAALRPGDVIYVEKGRYAGRAAVITTASRKGGVRLQVVTSRRSPLTIGAEDFTQAPRALGHIDLPVPFAPNRQGFQAEVARALDRVRLGPAEEKRRKSYGVELDTEVSRHPVEDDPDLGKRMKLAMQADRVAKELDDMRSRVKRSDGSVARQFDRVTEILAARGYLDGWALTEPGQRLARTFHECDLLINECLNEGLLDGLDPPTLAGLLSVFIYEHRSAEPAPAAWFPSGAIKKRWARILTISDRLSAEEEAAGLQPHRRPDATFLAIAFAWAAGEGFAEVVEAEELSGGDFVRTTKQLIDLLRQMTTVAPTKATRRTAQEASDALFRGVVASSSLIVAVDDGSSELGDLAESSNYIEVGDVSDGSADDVERGAPLAHAVFAPPSAADVRQGPAA